MWSLLLCVTAIVASNGAPLPEALHYIGVGYNLISGNPDGNFWATGGDDPGLLSTRKVLKLSSDVAIPTEIVYEHHDSCRHANEFAMFHDTSSYQAKLLERTKSMGTNNGALLAVAFTGSAGYKAIEQQTRHDFYVFQDEETTCTMGEARHKMGLAQGNHYGLSDEFAAASCALPLAYDAAIYRQFIDTWGTHVTTGVELGSLTIKRYVSPVKDFVDFVQDKSPRDVSLGGVFMNHASSLVVDMNAYKYRTLYRTVVGNLVDTLAVGSDTTPEPIGLSMQVISDVMDPSYWQHIDEYMSRGFCPHSSSALIAAVKVNLERALLEYANVTAPVSMPLAIPVTWPEGSYSLPKPIAGCPMGDFTWYDGWRFQDTESQTGDNGWSVGNHIDGELKKDSFKLKFCTKGEATPTVFDRNWPKGDYCILKYGNCPADFAEGYVKWDDENDLNRNNWHGVLPDGVYDEDTIMRYCCRSDALPTQPIILPTDTPFYLFQYKNSFCQTVANMQVTEEWLRWDDEDFLAPTKSMIGPVHPGMEFWNEANGASGSEIYYCYYSPQTK